VESLQTHRCRLVSDNGAELASVAAQLAAAETRRIRASPDRVTVLRWLELRYRGQNSELRIPWPAQVPVASLTAAFHGAHEREYGFASEDPIEVVAVGCRLEVATGQSWPAIATEGATPASSAVLVTSGGERRQVPVISLGELAAGAVITGPAVIAARFGSVTVWNGQTASWDKGGNVVLEAT
jgi:N-methylhydantoinase A/oxoprolinase/acetone carboxylase beta subunit